MVIPFVRRRLRGHFGISAARMTVKTRLPWWERGAGAVAVVVAVGALLWWAFDVGQALGSSGRKNVEPQTAVLENEAARLRSDASELRIRNSQLESDLAMSRGVQQTLSRQLAELAQENAKLKEESIVLQRLASDAGRQTSIRRSH